LITTVARRYAVKAVRADIAVRALETARRNVGPVATNCDTERPEQRNEERRPDSPMD
jgi:hypothetical protein